MDRMVEGHIYNTVILNLAPSGPMYGSAPDSPPFFSEGWWNILRRVLARAKAKGLRIWLYDQLGFSAAHIQERLMQRQPAWRAQDLAALQKDAEGPVTVRLTAPGRALAAAAIRLDAGGSPSGPPLNLTASLRDGRLIKELPAGRFRIMLFYETPGGFDYMSPTAAGRLINFVHGEFERKLKPYLGTTIPGTFQDELPPMNRWTRNFLDEFAKRKGYDLRPHLAMLWYDLGSRTTKVRCDVADVQAALLERAFFVPLYEWHQKHGMICSYDQATRDADPIAANRYYVDYMRTMRWFAAPGNDQTGTSRPHSSLAHLYGRPRLWLEGFYSSGWGQTLEELAGRIHEFYAQGSNLYNPHAWYYTTLGGWWEWAPPCTSFRQPYYVHYPLFSDYVARLSYLLSRGSHVADVALLHPSSTIHSASTHVGSVTPRATRARDAYWSLNGELDRASVDYDILDEASLLRASVKDGFLIIGSERYRCLVLPSATVLHRAAVAKLGTFVQSGGILAALGELPSASPDAGDNDPVVLKAMRALFGDETAPVRRSGKGLALLSLDDARALVQSIASRVPPHAVGAERYLHRRIGGLDTYLLIGRPGRSRFGEVTLKGTGAAWIADPWTGDIRRASSRPDGPGRTSVQVSFDAARATFVILAPPSLTLSQAGARRRPAAGLYPASAGLRQSEAKAASSRPLPPIPVDDEWRTALVPTLDNRWGDFALPASNGPVPIECRRFKYREEKESEDGIEAGWHTPDYGDSAWQAVTAGYGLRWWISRPDIGDRPLKMPGPDDGDWRPDPTIWSGAVFSLRSGIEKDPVHSETLGPKGRVPDEFLDFGTAPVGTVRFAVTFVHVPTACDAVIRCGAGDARVAVNGKWLPAGSAANARLLAGYNAIAAQFRHTSTRPLRTYVHIGPPDADAASPAWIWTTSTADVADCYARRTLDLANRPDWATMSITADNGYELYINGHRIGRDVGVSTSVWSEAERYSVARYLRSGRNVLAIRGMNLGGAAGIVAVLRYGSRSERSGVTLVTDGTWKVSSQAPSSWTQISFDDSSWPSARVIGLHPCEPWGTIAQLLRSTPGILPESGWLNGRVLPWLPELVIDPIPGMQKRVGWYRFNTPPGTKEMQVATKGRFRVFLDGREVPHTPDGSVEVPLDLQEHSQVCAIRVEQPAGRYGGAVFDAPVRFTVGVGAMRTGDWTRRGLPHYSGGVRYVQEVTVPAAYVGTPLVLDLGRVRGTAQVAINGRSTGVRLWRPYRFDVTDLVQPGTNRIEVTIYNTLGPHFGAGYPTPYVYAGQEASGLFGPVRLAGPSAEGPTAPNLSGLTDVALAANGATATASSEHPSGLYLADTVLAGHTSGTRWARGGGWNDGTEGEFPDWLEVTLARPVDIRAVRVITLEPAERFGIRDFDIMVRREGEWAVCAEIRNNDEESVVVGLPNIRSDRVRIVVHGSNDDTYSRIIAVNVYARTDSEHDAR
jgi:hypothetical protein